MPQDPELKNIELIFGTIGGAGSTKYFPPLLSLAAALKSSIGNRTSGHVTVNSDVLSKFATGSVEAWHRGLHSFLISASLTETSPIWASVSGYYASHYTMRAISHLFGFFQLFHQKVIVEIDPASVFLLGLKKRTSDSQEHKIYWKYVKACKYFHDDPIFTDNPETPSGTFTEFLSDQGHRNRANYADHIGGFRVFQPLDNDRLKARIEKISDFEINDPDIPDVAKYPDLLNVQLIAYHRLLRYRTFLDSHLSVKKGFWAFQRNPGWIPPYFDFQVTAPRYTTMFQDFLNNDSV